MICLTLNKCGNQVSEEKNNEIMERLYKQFWYGGTIRFSNQDLGCLFFFLFENLDIVVVVTLATASIALLCLLTSAEKKIHLPIEHVGTNF